MGKFLIFCAAGFDGLVAEIQKEDYILAADMGGNESFACYIPQNIVK